MNIKDMRELGELEVGKYYTHLSVVRLLNHKEDMGLSLDESYILYYMRPKDEENTNIYLFVSHPEYMTYWGSTNVEKFLVENAFKRNTFKRKSFKRNGEIW